MQNKRSGSPVAMQNKPASTQEIDYTPRSYPLRQQMADGVKMFAIAGIIFLLLWVFEAYFS
ncbi:hypothetical protein [Desulfosarcina sp.]|uniref:hypothetical protein n=1 Tax=Desulfosarcina sp. TaxID=2027861 RepID=UPI003567578B